MKKSICKRLLATLLSLIIVFSMAVIGIVPALSATAGSKVGGVIKELAVDKMVDIGMRLACEGMVAISEACEESGNDGVSKATALIAEWGLMSAEEAATTKNIELCEEILSELNDLTKITENGIASIETAIANLQVDFSTKTLTDRQGYDIDQVISDIKITGGVLDWYENYVEVASKYSDGSASDTEMLDAQYKFLLALRNYVGITTAIEGNTQQEQLESVSKQIFGDASNADPVNQNIEKIIGTLSKNLIIESGTHPKNVMSEAMALAYNYYPFSHQQYNFVTEQVGLQIHTIVEIMTMYNEILALQYGYLNQTQSLNDDQVSSLLATYDTHVDNFHNTLIPGTMSNINTMLRADYSVGSNVIMSIDDYMKPEDAVKTNLRTKDFVANYAANKDWGEYHTYHKLMTTTYGNTNSVYYLLNETKGLAYLYDYTYSNPDHGVSYDNITSDIYDGCNTFSLPDADSDSVDYKNLFNTNAFSLGGNVIRNYFNDYDSNGAKYSLLGTQSPLYLLTDYYTEEHGHVDESYVVDVDATQSSASSIKTVGFTPSVDEHNRDYGTYFTTVFSPTDTYKQKITAKASGADIQIVTKDSEGKDVTISKGSSAVIPSGNMLTIKMKIPEDVVDVSFTCTRDHDVYNTGTDPTIEFFDETLLNYLNVEDGYYIFEYPMPYSQCTFELNVIENMDADENGNFIIKTYEDLCQMADLVNLGIEKYTKGNYILANDIDCSGKEWTAPIGTTALYYSADPDEDGDWGFEGTFDGNGHVIKNLSAKGSSSKVASFGLFGTVSGTVKKLGMENFTYRGAGLDSRVGAVAGQILNGGKIVDCYLINGDINTMAFPRSGVVGGIAGANYSGTIENCYVYNLTVFSARSGGIVGDNHGDSNNADGTDRPGTIKNCYTSTGSICERGTATNSVVNVSAEQYASGEIAYLLNGSKTDGTQAWYQNLDNDLTPHSYPVLTSNGQNTVYKITLSDTTYSNFKNGDVLYTDKNGNFIIRSYEDLCTMSRKVNSGENEYVNGSYIVGDDITVPENSSFAPINTFSGTFDGQGYKISGLYVEGDEYVGLFRHNEGTIKNIGIVDSYFQGRRYVGSIVAENKGGTISNCYNTGEVQCTDSYGGGIAGYNTNDGTVTKCFGSGKVYSYWHAGGVVGYNDYGLVENCYNTGTINAYYNAGGIAGYNDGYKGNSEQDGVIENSYNIGVATAENSAGGIVGYNFYGQVRNTYNIETINAIGSDNGDGDPSEVFAKSAEQFKSGEVAYLLNKEVTDGTQAWYQNIDNGLTPDSYPVLTRNTRNAVYKVDLANITYSNTKPVLDIDENGNLIIRTYGDLCEMATSVNSGKEIYTKGSYIVVNDITAPENSSFAPINTFSGTFDGQGHKISGLYVEGNEYVGLFRHNEGTIKNIGIVDSYIQGYRYVGSIVAENKGGTISNCYNTGEVQCTASYGGGIVGYNINGGTVTKCFSAGKVYSYWHAGGVVGYNNYGIVENCYNTGTINGYYNVGGIAGYNQGREGNSEYDGVIENSYNIGVVTAEDYVGGIVGYNYYGQVRNSYNIETINAIGYDYDADDLREVFAKSAEQFKSGEVAYLLNKEVTDGTQAWYQNIDNGLSPDSYPVLTNNGQNTVYKVDLSDKTYSNFEDGVFDIFDTDENGNFIIRTYEDLCNMATSVNSGDETYTKGSYIVANDITAPENSSFAPINTFSGTFDGQGHKISGLYVDGDDYVGLFRHNEGTIKNIGIVDSYFQGRKYVGSIVAENKGGTISNCYNTGEVQCTDSYGGGIAGYNTNDGTVTKCFGSGKVYSYWHAGGVVGYNDYGIVENCYNTGTINAYYNAGGIAGYNDGYAGNSEHDGVIENSYNIGVATAENNAGGIVGYNYYGQVRNSYNIETINAIGYDYGDGDPREVFAKSDEQFKSGEVAYLLNGEITDGTQAWYQNLDNGKIPDFYPQLTSNGVNTVYALLDNKGYSNYQQTAKESVLQRVDLRTYHRVLEEDGTFSESTQFTTGFGLVDNENKVITVYCLEGAERLGILANQGADGSAGYMTLEGYDEYKYKDKTSADLIKEGNEPDIYVDANGCIFIKVPEDGSDVTGLTVNYTQKPTSEYKTTQYTLNVITVSPEHLRTVGASNITLSESDPDNGVTEEIATNEPSAEETTSPTEGQETTTVPSDSTQDNKPTDSTTAPSDSKDDKTTNTSSSSTNNKNSSTSNSGTVKTGNTMNVAIPLILLISAFAGVFVYRRKKSE